MSPFPPDFDRTTFEANTHIDNPYFPLTPGAVLSSHRQKLVMRIAFVVGEFPVLSESFILNQIVGLIDRGHEVDIYSLKGASKDNKVHPPVEEYRLLERTQSVPKVSKNYLRRCLKGLELLSNNFFKHPLVCLRSLNVVKYGKRAASLRLLYSATSVLGDKPYDIIHCQFGTYALEGRHFHDAGGMLLRELGALRGKLIVSFRGYDISSFVKRRGETVYNQLFATGDFFLANCEFFERKAIQLGCPQGQIAVNRSGIDCSKFAFSPRYPSPDGRTRIVTVGRLVGKKGIEYGIRAVAKLSKTYSLEYSIVGDGELRKDLEELIETLDVSHIVKLLGWRNQQEIVEILNNSQISIAPSVTYKGSQDAPVNTLKEAMATGMPVIGTAHGGIPELVKDGVTGFLVPERDADAIAERISYLVEHPEIWTRIGRAGRTYVEEHYDIHKLNDELVKIYRQVLDREEQQSPLARSVIVKA